MKILLSAIATSAILTAVSSASIVITEWMYQGGGPGEIGEFIEFTNIGTTAVDMTGWRYDDDSRSYAAGFSLSGFGMVEPGQSVIITDMNPAEFRSNWDLPPTVVVLGPYTNNLGRADEINLFDAGGNLVDRLTYADNGAAGGPRTQAISGITDPENYGLNNASLWYHSSITDGPTLGDGLSWISTSGEIGSPGIAAIPEPSASLLAGLAVLAAGCRRKRVK